MGKKQNNAKENTITQTTVSNVTILDSIVKDTEEYDLYISDYEVHKHVNNRNKT